MPNVYDIGDSIELEGTFTSKNTLGTIQAGSTSLVVQDASGYAAADPIKISGAGDAGGDLVTTVSGSPAGNTITLAVTAKTSVIRAPVGKLTAPTTVTLKVRLPDGTESSPSVSTPSVGRYLATYDAVQAGQHWFGFKGTGTAKAKEQEEFIVREERVT